MHPHRPFGLLSGVILLGTTILSSTAALAASPGNPPTREITFVKADLTDPVAAGRLYMRIQRAAKIVCEQPFAREADRYIEFKKCYDRAVDTAVANVDSAMLSAVHRSRTLRTAAG